MRTLSAESTTIIGAGAQVLLVAVLSITLAALASSAQAFVSTDIQLSPPHPAAAGYTGLFFTPNSTIEGSVAVQHDWLPGATVGIYIDDQLAASAPLNNYFKGIGNYSFRSLPFSYKINGTGTRQWTSFVDQYFNVKIKANGTRAGTRAGTTPWEYPSSELRGAGGTGFRVNGSENLKYTGVNGSDPSILYMPTDANKDTMWYVVSNSNPDVTLSMREACGSGTYYTSTGFANTTSPDGWVRKGIAKTAFSRVGTSAAFRTADFERFDFDSLFQHTDYSSFSFATGAYQKGGIGGVYRNGVYQQFTDYNNCINNGPEDTAYWESSNLRNGNGMIIICRYDSFSNYTITYLPPNGPYVCAWTGTNQTKSADWTSASASTESASTAYNKPYSKSFSGSALPSAPACCTNPCVCTSRQLNLNYFASNTTALGCIDFSSSYSSPNLTVSASTACTDFTKNETLTIDLASLTDSAFQPLLKAPANVSGHNLTVNITLNGATLANQTVGFATCKDKDGDGYCRETGDCNDNDPFVYPGRVELCNGKDDNCDGKIDEPWPTKGQPCGLGACAGTMVCTTDKRNVTCSKGSGGPAEICGNSVDDNCNGIVDEELWTDPKTGKQMPCVCDSTAGKNVQPCGSNIGECKAGQRICANGTWGDCIGATGLGTEVCNGKDDDCNGKIDDVGGGKSVEATKCACYNSLAQPGKNAETCNGIDDNCNGQIDEGLTCCAKGDTRSCAEAGLKGECSKGIETCSQAGSWGDCSIVPKQEICYNKLDDNCDGVVDNPDVCTPEITCQNGIQDQNEDGVDCGEVCKKACQAADLPMLWYGIAGIGIAVIAIIGVLFVIGII